MFRITIKTTLSFVRLHAPGYSFSFLLPSNLFLAAWRQTRRHGGRGGSPPTALFLPKEPRESLFSSSFFSDYPIDYAILPVLSNPVVLREAFVTLNCW